MEIQEMEFDWRPLYKVIEIPPSLMLDGAMRLVDFGWRSRRRQFIDHDSYNTIRDDNLDRAYTNEWDDNNDWHVKCQDTWTILPFLE